MLIDEAARPATESDLGVVAELARAAIAELAPNRGGALLVRREARPEPVEASLAADLTGDGRLLLVGTIDDAVVGYAAARTEPLHDGRTLVVLSDVYVLPAGRGVGVGEAMLDLVLAWCDDVDAVGLDALALPGDRHTKNFFETFGLTARAIVVHRRVAEA